MIRLVVCSQRAGVAKTTTAMTLGRLFADHGMRVLLIDADAEGRIHQMVRVKPDRGLYDVLVRRIRLPDCVIAVHREIDLLASNRMTQAAEFAISNEMGSERILHQLLRLYEKRYDAIIIDCAPVLSALQNSCMVYARNVVIPAAMDTPSIQGALATISAIGFLNRSMQSHLPNDSFVRPIGLLPVMLTTGFQTDVSISNLEMISKEFGVALLPGIQSDNAVSKATKARQFLQDYDADSVALGHYAAAGEVLMQLTTREVKVAEAIS